ncbi:DUF547 domain-containing protein [Aurantibacter sp.]|uniref:DUF547 domain-containing protein n=1 Tax=Aurantibacter sp. TaxID=2807103 RepID=UPI0035C7ABAC
MKNLFFITIVSLFTLQSSAQNLDQFFNSSDVFFKTYVKNGLVDYSSINKNDLNTILENASKITVIKSDVKNFQAFWINAYNLTVIKSLLDNMPIKSPLDKAGFFDKKTYHLAGKQITLNDIEHKLLRANFKDARFHFVLVCGALGCPPLISKAYLPSTLDTQLTVQTKKAINGSFLQVKATKIQASEIMKWYKEDFTMNGKTEIDFINKYRTEKVPEKAKISYFPYNWTINKQ